MILGAIIAFLIWFVLFVIINRGDVTNPDSSVFIEAPFIAALGALIGHFVG